GGHVERLRGGVEALARQVDERDAGALLAHPPRGRETNSGRAAGHDPALIGELHGFSPLAFGSLRRQRGVALRSVRVTSCTSASLMGSARSPSARYGGNGGLRFGRCGSLRARPRASWVQPARLRLATAATGGCASVGAGHFVHVRAL